MSHSVTIRMPLDQYAALVDMVQIADWVITSREPLDAPEMEIYRQTRRSVLTHLVGSGLEENFEYVEQHGDYFETPEYEDDGAYRKFLEDYENSTFWDHLVDRLVSRDVLEALGEERISAMPPNDRHELWRSVREKYELEFEKAGLENLRLR